jgi:hypothetical protein
MKQRGERAGVDKRTNKTKLQKQYTRIERPEEETEELQQTR